MSDLTARLLDPKTFEKTLQETRFHRSQDSLFSAIRELHCLLAKAKAESAAAQDLLDWLEANGHLPTTREGIRAYRAAAIDSACAGSGQ